MARPTDPAVLDDAIERYLAGEPKQQILAATGISHTAFCRERARRGIPARTVAIDLPTEDIVTAYQAGESELSLGRRYGVSRNAVRRRLEASGVQIRSHSAAGRVRAAQMTAEDREIQSSAAHAAARGSRRTHAQLIAHAEALEAIGRHASPAEALMARWLCDRGLVATPQKAIGKYNVDLAVTPVAVEVLGGGWHLEKRSHTIRTPQILDAGWHMAFVWDHEGDSALSEGAADYVVAFLDEMRRKPPATGQYRVISGSGELLAAGGRDDGQFALVAPPRGRKTRRS